VEIAVPTFVRVYKRIVQMWSTSTPQPTIRSLADACAVARSEAQRQSWRDSVLAGRQGMFAQLQRATAPFNLTGEKHDTAEREDAAVARRLATQHGRRLWPMLVVGDSVARELAVSLDHLLPGGSDQASHLIKSFASSAVSFWFHSSTKMSHDWSAQREQHYMRDAHWYEANMSQIFHRLDACEVDALFVGGYGNWQLRRGFRKVSGERRASPVRAYERFIRGEMAIASCLAQETAIPVIFIGTIPTHAPTVLLDPPKQDWADQYDLALAGVYAAVERAIFSEMQQSGGREPGFGATGVNARLHLISSADLVGECPLARCDGIHFGSDFPTFRCRSSMVLWHRFVAGFLRSSGILDVAPATRHRACKKARRTRFHQQHQQELANGTMSKIRPSHSMAWSLLDTCARRLLGKT
jgi:hypothetical protein